MAHSLTRASCGKSACIQLCKRLLKFGGNCVPGAMNMSRLGGPGGYWDLNNQKAIGDEDWARERVKDTNQSHTVTYAREAQYVRYFGLNSRGHPVA
jgi:hypothetical protein